jgi:hypothetical protein
MFNTLGLEAPPWFTRIHTTNAMVLLKRKKSATPGGKKQTSAGMFAPTSSPACLEQFDLITIPGRTTLLAVQIATSLAGFLWCGALKISPYRWLSLHSSWISPNDKASGEQNPDRVSGPRHLTRSSSYSFFGVGRCHRDLPHIRSQLCSRPLSRQGLERLKHSLEPTEDERTGAHSRFVFREYTIFTEPVLAVNESRVYVSTVSWSQRKRRW